MRQFEAEPVAIVGMACIYPGAHSPAELWDAVLHQRSSFRRIPSSRLPFRDYGPGSTKYSNDTLYVQSAGLIDGWSFDIERFRIPQNLYEAADLTHWLALDTMNQLLMSLGIPGRRDLPRETTGVILGNSMAGDTSRSNALRLRWPYIARALRDAATSSSSELTDELFDQFESEFKSSFPEPGDETLAGSLANTIAGRLCNYFDFHGTGYTVDGACSSSLLAVMTALNCLAQRSLDFAICGGVDVSLDPFELVGFARLNALSRDVMRVYDERPTGFLPGEGCGLIAMMRLDDAVQRGFPIRAILHSVGTSSDGAGGLTRPVLEGHLLAARRAYDLAGIDSRDVEYFEGHGTGTRVGDPLEVEVFRSLKAGANSPAAFGSIKANIGHTKAAAGIAGLIKAVSAVENAVLPPATGIVTPLAAIQRGPELSILREAQTWPSRTRIAGISALGFGGINTHAVITNAPPPAHRQAVSTSIPVSARTGAHEVWIVSAQTKDALILRLHEVGKRLEEASDAACGSLAWELALDDASSNQYRTSFVARNVEEAVLGLSAAEMMLNDNDDGSESRPFSGNADGTCFVRRGGPPVRVGLLFPGQGAPTPRAGTVLETLSRPGPLLDAAKNGLKTLGKSPSRDTSVAQPAIVSASLLGLAWLDSLGVAADVAVGHSLGEITALTWAGVLDPHSAVELAQQRGACMSRCGAPDTGMVSVATDASGTEELIREFSPSASGQPLVAAGFNSFSQTVVSGTTIELSEFKEFARRRSIAVTSLVVSHGFHSWAMNDAVVPFAEALERIALEPSTLHVISSITGEQLSESSDIPALLLRQLTSPVRFVAAMKCVATAADLLIECGPGRILTKLASQQASIPCVSLNVGGDPAELARTTAALSAAGAIENPSAWWDARAHEVSSPGRTQVLISNPCGRRAGDKPLSSFETDGTASNTLGHKLVAQATETPSREEEDPARASSQTLNSSSSLDRASMVRDIYLNELADRTHLPASDLVDGLSLLRDLHLNSLQVSQIFNLAAAKLNRQQPENPLSLSDATVGETIELLMRLDDAGDDSNSRAASAAAWAATYVDSWVDIPDRGPWQGLRWTSLADAAANGANAAFVTLHRSDDYDHIADTLRGLASAASDYHVIAIVHDGTGVAVARSLALESASDSAIVSITTTARPEVATAALPELGGTFHDLMFDGGCWLTRRAGALHGEILETPLTPGGLCLVTGGMTGITAECAVEMAKAYDVSLIFTGRSHANSDRVAPMLETMRDAGVEARYIECDLTKPLSCERLLAQAAVFGAVRSILHGAGINDPRPLKEVTGVGLQAADAVKSVALRNLVDACPTPETLELIVAFGSIIGRAGLAGNAEYSIANDRMRTAAESISLRLPRTVVRHFEWSVWNSVGMGISLGVVDDLARAGVAAISPELGRRAFLEGITTGGPTTRAVLSSFPSTPTLVFDTPPFPHARFVERIVSQTGTSELIAEADLSTATDVAVSEHRMNGMAILPAVQSLEAIAQLVSAMGANGGSWHFQNVRLASPIVVDDLDFTTIRLAAAQVGHSGNYRATIRSSNDRFSQVAVECTVKRTSTWHQRTLPSATMVCARSVDHLYGPLFFHGRPFQALTAIHALSASRLSCTLASTESSWLSQFLPPDLVLGDPGMLDACVHTLQACFPNARLLPTKVGALIVRRAMKNETVTLRAVEKIILEPSGDIDRLRFDVDIYDSDGSLIVVWRDIDLTLVGPLSSSLVDVRLCGPFIARRVRALTTCPTFDATVSPISWSPIDACTLLGFAKPYHSPSGRLLAPTGGVSTSSSGDWRLTVGAPDHAVGVDWVTEDEGTRNAVVARRDSIVLHQLTAMLPQREDVLRLVIWTARESMVKAGKGYEAALEIRSVREDDDCLEIVFSVAGCGSIVGHHIHIAEPDARRRSIVSAVFVSADPSDAEIA